MSIEGVSPQATSIDRIQSVGDSSNEQDNLGQLQHSVTQQEDRRMNGQDLVESVESSSLIGANCCSTSAEISHISSEISHDEDSLGLNTVSTFPLKDITASPYYFELTDTAVTRNITFFAAYCRHKVGERLTCLRKLFVKLSQEDKHYNFGRVLYLTMLWKEGVVYINGLSGQQIEEELQHANCLFPQKETWSVSSKNHLLQWLEGIAQTAVDLVVSKLNSNSLDILNALAGDDETVIVSEYMEDYDS